MDVRAVLEAGDVIEAQDLDDQATKRIYFAHFDSVPLHVVAIDDGGLKETQVVTVYEPDLQRWQPGFRQRRTS